ncbi:hypothetical protein B0H13DRAFT_2389947 [Mycena leptocephala]|nr:hypothetical protein B0H13DRAFT_2389947 [Mycena leptocephala]
MASLPDVHLAPGSKRVPHSFVVSLPPSHLLFTYADSFAPTPDLRRRRKSMLADSLAHSSIFSVLDVICSIVFPHYAMYVPSSRLRSRASRSLPISAPRLTSLIPRSTPVEYPILRSYARQVDRPPTARIPRPTFLSLHPPPFRLPPSVPCSCSAPAPLPSPLALPPHPPSSSSALLFPLPPQTKLTPKKKLPLRPPLSRLYSNALLSTLNGRVRLGARGDGDVYGSL